MPGTATGACRRKQRNVAAATSSTEAGRVHSLPAMTIGLEQYPWTPCSKKAWNTA
jgi:hypothetical protein